MEIHSFGTCPKCAKEYPIYAEETAWCDSCDWNIEGNQRFIFKESAFLNLHRTLGKKISQQLFNDLRSRMITRPRMTAEKILVFAFATLIHLGSLLILGLVGALYLNMHGLIASFISLPLLMLFWTIIPKPRKLPKEVVKRDDFPTLYQIADDVADAMKTERPFALAIDHEFNAYYTEFGIGKRKKKLICLGLPLVTQLTDEELVAVLSHETSHGANGDASRSAYVNLALNTLANLYHALTPRHINEGDSGFVGAVIATWVANLLGWIFSHIPLVAYKIQVRLLFRQQQEAEYLADTLATEVCGTPAMLSTLEKLESASNFTSAIEKASFSTDKNIDVFEVAKAMNAKPKSDHEKERLKRLDISRGLSLDATHPPTAYRREFISRIVHLPQVRLTSEQHHSLHKELDTLRSKISYQLIEDFREGISG